MPVVYTNKGQEKAGWHGDLGGWDSRIRVHKIAVSAKQKKLKQNLGIEREEKSGGKVLGNVVGDAWNT